MIMPTICTVRGTTHLWTDGHAACGEELVAPWAWYHGAALLDGLTCQACRNLLIVWELGQ